MKCTWLVAIGLALSLSVVGAQTTTDENQNQEQKEKAKTEENAKAHKAVKPEVQTKERTEANQEGTNPKQRVNEKARTGNEKAESQNVRTEKTGTRTETKSSATRTEKESNVSGGGVTVFRNGHETTEHITLHRSTREQTDVHFSIGIHPRDWWLRTYSVVLMEGCPYYLADNGCWYPAYGFEPGCNYPVGIVFCE